MEIPLKSENYSFWKNLILVTIFFTLTPVILGVSLFSLFSLTSSKVSLASLEESSYQLHQNLLPSGIKVYASLPGSFPSVLGVTNTADARAEIVRQYLDYYNSPLTPFYQTIVQTADEYGLDFRLITAIAQKESNLCKIIPPGSFNCWGWGIHSAGTLGFDSFDQGIRVVSQGLAEEYLGKGYITLEEIMSKYTPLSNGSWAQDVARFMGEME